MTNTTHHTVGMENLHPAVYSVNPATAMLTVHLENEEGGALCAPGMVSAPQIIDKHFDGYTIEICDECLKTHTREAEDRGPS